MSSPSSSNTPATKGAASNAKQGREGYQSRLNALLRSVILRDLGSKRKRA
ncbi:MAG: hypothetical protein ACYCOR_11135 [Acidobacteriaceae bacterium]